MMHMIVQISGKVIDSSIDIKNTSEFYLKEGTKREMFNELSKLLKAASRAGFIIQDEEIERMSKEAVMKILSSDFRETGARHKIVSRGLVHMGYIKIYALRR